ncbi:CEP78 family protein [Megaselia abdita]
MDHFNLIRSNGKKNNHRNRSFHLHYLELCRSKNFSPIPEVKALNNNSHIHPNNGHGNTLDFFGDKLKYNDWILLIEALYYDQMLETIAIRLRRCHAQINEQIDSEKKVRSFKNRPAIYTKYIFDGIVAAISNCIQFNANLKHLTLESLPLNEKYMISICKALSCNTNLKTLSFARSTIGDKGCENICSTVKYLINIESIEMSQCELTYKGACAIADMIRFQKIFRYSEGWKKSLRYRDVNPDNMPGLRSIAISDNADIGDNGVKSITEVLKEDDWIKTILMENCGLTDVGANYVLDCLALNKHLVEFSVKKNSNISKYLVRNILLQLGKEDIPNMPKKSNKVSPTKLKEHVKLLEEQFESEKNLRKQGELLNEQLHAQIVAYEKQLNSHEGSEQLSDIPCGYDLVPRHELDQLLEELSTYKKCKNGSIRKVRSETTSKPVNDTRNKNKVSSSEHTFNAAEKKLNNLKQSKPIQCQKKYFESNIGDTFENDDLYNINTSRTETFDTSSVKLTQRSMGFNGIEQAFQIFIEKKQKSENPNSLNFLLNNRKNNPTSAKSLFK